MADGIDRRDFLKRSALMGLGAVVGEPLFNQERTVKASSYLWEGQPADISVVKGGDFYQNTLKAVEFLGGMEKFVPSGSKVALLPNVQRWNPGTFTKPEILRAVIQMCRRAGADEVNILSWLGRKNWEDTGLAQVIQQEGASLKLIPREEAEFRTVKIPRGEAMKDVMIMKEFFNHDIFIDMPITKDHAGNKFTGTMKNLMGINFPTHNRSNFHKQNWTTDPEAIKHLDRCIVDLNLAVKPSLCVVDATEFIITNGPMGPGELTRPHKVIAGVDRVAIDALCTTLWDVQAENVTQIVDAHRRGLGTMDLEKVRVVEQTLRPA